MTTNLYVSQTHAHTSRELPIDFTFVQEVTAFATHFSIQQSGQAGLTSKLTAGFARPNIADRSNCISFGDNMADNVASLSSTPIREFTYVSQSSLYTKNVVLTFVPGTPMMWATGSFQRDLIVRRAPLTIVYSVDRSAGHITDVVYGPSNCMRLCKNAHLSRNQFTFINADSYTRFALVSNSVFGVNCVNAWE